MVDVDTGVMSLHRQTLGLEFGAVGIGSSTEIPWSPWKSLERTRITMYDP